MDAAEQEAVEQATAALLAARQVGVDLYSGVRTDVNDLDDVTTGEFREETIAGVRKRLNDGWTSEPKGVQVRLVSARPTKVNVDRQPPAVVIRACVDSTAETQVSPQGERLPGSREEFDYVMVYTTYRSTGVWAVAGVTGAPDAEDRQC